MILRLTENQLCYKNQLITQMILLKLTIIFISIENKNYEIYIKLKYFNQWKILIHLKQ